VTGPVPRFRSVTASPLAALSRSGDRGATAVEYALIVALIAAVIIGVVIVLGHAVSDDFQSAVSQWLAGHRTGGRLRRPVGSGAVTRGGGIPA
jgi:pilus assembly protein Flp/PilA